MRRLITFVLFSTTFCYAMAQNGLAVGPVLEFLGCIDISDADASEVERLHDFMDEPLRINSAEFRELKESGLLNPYQIVSLEDYRNSHGDLLSLMELSSIDGFSEGFVKKLAPFISLDSGTLTGKSLQDGKVSRQELNLRAFVKPSVSEDTDSQFSYGARFQAEYGNTFSVRVAVNRPYTSEIGIPGSHALGLAWSPHRTAFKLIVGDFNARFGQGLALWNGMSIGGLSSPSAFARRPSGLSLSSSYTGNTSFTGVAAEYAFGHFSVSTMVAVPGIKALYASDMRLLPAVNMTLLTGSGQFGISHYAEFSGVFDNAVLRIPDMKTSADMTCCFRGVDVFAEASVDWVGKALASVAGLTFPAGEALRLAALVRYYPYGYVPSLSGAVSGTSRCSNEHGIAVAAEFAGGQWIKLNCFDEYGANVRRINGKAALDFTFLPVAKADGYNHSLQIKASTDWQWTVSSSFQVKARITERIRSWGLPFRTDFRADLLWFSSPFNATARINLLKSDGLGCMSYIEGGFKDSKCSAYGRVGVFMVDDWDDRIYVYERDGPGCFNVPALYGRGLWISLSASVRTSRSGRLYLRGSLTSYALMDIERRKPGKAELKLQYVVKF